MGHTPTLKIGILQCKTGQPVWLLSTTVSYNRHQRQRLFWNRFDFLGDIQENILLMVSELDDLHLLYWPKIQSLEILAVVGRSTRLQKNLASILNWDRPLTEVNVSSGISYSKSQKKSCGFSAFPKAVKLLFSELLRFMSCTCELLWPLWPIKSQVPKFVRSSLSL